MLRIIENPDDFRKNVIDRLESFSFDRNTCENMEKGIFNYSLKEATACKLVKKWDNPLFVCLYMDRLRSVYINLNNPKLCDIISKKVVRAHEIAFMTHQEMDPDRWSELIESKIKRDKKKYETRMAAATDTFKCRNCKSNECTYYQLQTRSADEPMTTFVTCINCGNKWRC